MNDFDYLNAAMERKDRGETWERCYRHVNETYDAMRDVFRPKVIFPKQSDEFMSRGDPNHLVRYLKQSIAQYYAPWNPLDRELKAHADAFIGAVQALLDESLRVVNSRASGNIAAPPPVVALDAPPVNADQANQSASAGYALQEIVAPALTNDPSAPSALGVSPQLALVYTIQTHGDAGPTHILQPLPSQEPQHLLDRSDVLEQHMADMQSALANAQAELLQIKTLAGEMSARHVTRKDYDKLLYQYNQLTETHRAFQQTFSNQLIQTMTTLSNQLGVDLSSGSDHAQGLVSREVIDSAVKTMSIRLETILRNASGLAPIPITPGMPYDDTIMEDSEQREPTDEPRLANRVARIVERGFWRPSGQSYIVDRPAKVALYVVRKRR